MKGTNNGLFAPLHNAVSKLIVLGRHLHSDRAYLTPPRDPGAALRPKGRRGTVPSEERPSHGKPANPVSDHICPLTFTLEDIAYVIILPELH